MHSSPLNKHERQGMSFAFVGWTAGKNAIQASEFSLCRAVEDGETWDEFREFWRTIMRLAEHNCETG